MEAIQLARKPFAVVLESTNPAENRANWPELCPDQALSSTVCRCVDDLRVKENGAIFFLAPPLESYLPNFRMSPSSFHPSWLSMQSRAPFRTLSAGLFALSNAAMRVLNPSRRQVVPWRCPVFRRRRLSLYKLFPGLTSSSLYWSGPNIERFRLPTVHLDSEKERLQTGD